MKSLIIGDFAVSKWHGRDGKEYHKHVNMSGLKEKLWRSSRTYEFMEIRPGTGFGYWNLDKEAGGSYSLRSRVAKMLGYKLPKGRAAKARMFKQLRRNDNSLSQIWNNLVAGIRKRLDDIHMNDQEVIDEAKKEFKAIFAALGIEYSKEEAMKSRKLMALVDDVCAKRKEFLTGMVHKPNHKSRTRKEEVAEDGIGGYLARRFRLSAIIDNLEEDDPIATALIALYEIYGDIYIRREALKELKRGGVFHLYDRSHWPDQVVRGYHEKANSKNNKFWKEHPEFENELSMDRGRRVIKEDGSVWEFDPEQNSFVMTEGPQEDPRDNTTYIDDMGGDDDDWDDGDSYESNQAIAEAV